jgi:hypothetical protein
LTFLIRPELRDKNCTFASADLSSQTCKCGSLHYFGSADLSLNLLYLEDTDIQEQE